jgi:hypothetical protein
MKAEAESILKQKDERDKKSKEDDERARIRRKKWAALTMQGYARTFLARRVLRQAAYKRYLKHFDPGSHNYFYEDKRTHETTWEKPNSLGSYDITMENYWILMRAVTAAGVPITEQVAEKVNPEDPNSETVLKDVPLVYYYNPCTWKQTWTRPEGTVLCEQCVTDFAHRFLNYDQRKYCDACFAVQAQYLVEAGMHPKYVTFKTFQGGSEKAHRTDFFSLPDESWFMLIMDANPQLKQSEEEEVAAVKRARKRAQAGSAKSGTTGSGKSSVGRSQRSGKYGQVKAKHVVELCGVCDDRIAVLTCKDCETLYCKDCCDVTHSIASHAFHVVETYIPEVDLGAYGEEGAPSDASPPEKSRKKSKKSKKSRKSKRQKSGNPGDASGTDADASEADYDTDASSWPGDASNAGASTARSRDGSVGSESAHKKHKKSKKKHRKERDGGEAVSDFADSDLDGASKSSGVSKSRSKHKKDKHGKHKRSKSAGGVSDAEGVAAGNTAPEDTGKHKKHKHKKDKALHGADGSDGAFVSAASSPSKHKHQHKKEKKHHSAEQDTDAGSRASKASMASKASKEAKGSKHSKESKHKKHRKETDAPRAVTDLSAYDTGAQSGLSDAESGYVTGASREHKKHKRSKHAKGRSSDGGDSASRGASRSESPKKHKKHHKDKADRGGSASASKSRSNSKAKHSAVADSDEDAVLLGGDFADAFAGLDLHDGTAELAAEHSSPEKAHKKKHKKDKKDKKLSADTLGFESSAEEASSPEKGGAKKNKKHKHHVRSGGEATPGAESDGSKHKHHKHKREKENDRTAGIATSSSLKLPDIYQKHSLGVEADAERKKTKKEKHHQQRDKLDRSGEVSSSDGSPEKHRHHKSRAASAPAMENVGFESELGDSAVEDSGAKKKKHKHKHSTSHGKSGSGTETEGGPSDVEGNKAKKKHKHRHKDA